MREAAKDVAQTVAGFWRDPTFFGFLLFGAALLCAGAMCQTQAATSADVVATTPSRSLAPAPEVTFDGGFLPSADDRFGLTYEATPITVLEVVAGR